MAQLFIYFTFLILISCSAVTPIYVAKINPYNYESRTISATNLIKVESVYLYNTEELNTNYTNYFCAKLKDCNHNIHNIKSNADFAYFDITKNPIKNNPYAIESIALLRIIYTTVGQKYESRMVSGAVFIPQNTHIRGILLFYHPTYFNKMSVPSSSPDSGIDQALASVFATQGYIVLAPDYIGMGYDKNTFHPYVLYPQVNTFDGVAMLNAFRNYAIQTGIQLESNTSLFVSGYSEGASYALWFSRLYQEVSHFKEQVNQTGFRPRQVLPISGAYNLSSVTYSYLFTDINIITKNQFNISNSYLSGIIKPALLAYALNSYVYYDLNQNYNQIYNPIFFNMGYSTKQSTTYKNDGQQNIATIFASEKYKDRQIVDKIYDIASDELNISPLAFNQWNNLSVLVQESILYNPYFMRFMHHGDVYYWHSTLPTTLIYLKHDSVVSSLNSIYAYQGLSENHSTNLKFIEMDNNLIHENMGNYIPDLEIDHLNGFYYLFLIALNQMNQSLSTITQ